MGDNETTREVRDADAGVDRAYGMVLGVGRTECLDTQVLHVNLGIESNHSPICGHPHQIRDLGPGHQFPCSMLGMKRSAIHEEVEIVRHAAMMASIETGKPLQMHRGSIAAVARAVCYNAKYTRRSRTL